MGEQNKPGSGAGSEGQRGWTTPGQQQRPMAPPNKSDTNLDPKENDRKNRDQGSEKKNASEDEVATNPNVDPDDTDDDRPPETPAADDRPSA